MRSEDEIRERIKLLNENYERFYKEGCFIEMENMGGRTAELEWVLQEDNQ
jgi:hypothetical protein